MYLNLHSNDKPPNEEIHIGKLMQKKITEDGHTISWFARKIHRERSAIYAIFKNPHIHTSLLVQISIVLDYDFFQCFSDHLAKKQDKT